MRKINFKLFFYIILVVLILETVIITLNLTERNKIHLSETKENLKYNTGLLAAKLEKNMNSVEILGDVFATSVKNKISVNNSEEKKVLDDELYNILITTNIIGGYYEFNSDSSELLNSMHFDKKENKYNTSLSNENINEIKSSIEEEKDKESGWKIPVYIKSWDTNTALYHKNIYVDSKVRGTVVLAVDYNKLEEELLTLNGDTGSEYYLVDSENNILFTNNLDIKSKNIKTIDDSDFLSAIKGIQTNDFRTGIFENPKEKRQLYSYYKLDNKNIFVMKKHISRIENIEFYEKTIWIILLLNIVCIFTIYIILRKMVVRPADRIDKALLDISKKKLKNIESKKEKRDEGYLVENYNRVVKSYTDLVLDMREKSDIGIVQTKKLVDITGGLLKKNLSKETKISNINSQLQKNHSSFDKVYNLIMENHKLNTATQEELGEVDRNIKILREKFSIERENGDEIEKITSEINKISFQINVFGINSTIGAHSNSNNSSDFEESSKEIRHLANRVKFLSEEIKAILKKEKINFQIKNKSLNLITDYVVSFSERLSSIKKSHEKEIIKYVENTENLGSFSFDLEALRKEIITNQDIFAKEVYQLKKLEESLKNISLMMNEYEINSDEAEEE